MNWVMIPLRRSVDFSGRSRRTEFWVFALVVLTGQLLATYLDVALGSTALLGRMRTLEAIFTLALLVPISAVSVRRLHDTGRAGWWMLLLALPYVIWLATTNGSAVNSAALLAFALASLGLFVLLVQPGTAGENAYGEDPKGDTPVADDKTAV